MFTDANSDGHCYANSDAVSYANSHTYTYNTAESYTDGYGYGFSEIYAITPAASDTGAAADAVRVDQMSTNRKRTSPSSRLRTVLRLFVLIGASCALMTAISSPPIDQAGSAHPRERESDGAGISVNAGATPTPTPSCPRCYVRMVLSEYFDSVIPPTLPTNWLATNALGPPPLWVTSNSGVPVPPADTSPNAAYIDDPAVASDKRLDSLHFAATYPQLTFRHNFDLEASEVDPNLGFDGGVLEISFDGGNTFQDILAIGGTFLEGGYNRTISTDRGSPIAGRQAWSGNSGGFITTVVIVPWGFGNGVLRWRMASDNSGSNEGWRVDTVNIAWCQPVGCPTSTPKPRPTPRPRPTPAPRP